MNMTTADFDPLKSDDLANMQGRLVEKWRLYDGYDAYVRGDQDLRFATDKFTNAFGGLFRAFADNYCKRVVQTLSDYLQLKAVESGKGDVDGDVAAWLKSQRIDAQSGRVHGDAFKYGDGYIVLEEDDAGDLRLFRQEPRSVRVMYDPANPSRVSCALKMWRELSNKWRLNIYLPDGVYRYVSRSSGGTKPISDTAEAKSPNVAAPVGLKGFAPVADLPFLPAIVPGIVPVFHFPNESDITGQGTSELSDVIPLQDALNKSVCDMMVAMEFQAYRQRYATGIEVDIDPVTGKPIPPKLGGSDRLFYSESSEVKFGEFQAADLKPFIEVSDSFRSEIARIARIPLHHLAMSDSFPSGEALKTAESPLIAKVRDRQIEWGNVWEDIVAFRQVYRKRNETNFDAVWENTSPRSRTEDAQADELEVSTIEGKRRLGVSRKQCLSELGYSDAQIKEFETANATESDANRQGALDYLMTNETPLRGAEGAKTGDTSTIASVAAPQPGGGN